jgi:hypothetical protein
MARYNDKGCVVSAALNMDIAQASEASKRVELGMASLEALGVL